ncbi:MAG: hypothetical protein DWB60_06180 [Armatimonadetes bacterium]|nr:hypothetical protein [Armatimonadota bacterium]
MVQKGRHSRIRALERELEEHLPLPGNRVRWAGRRAGLPLPKHLHRFLKHLKVIRPIAIAMAVFEGPEAFARSIVFADEIEAIGGVIKRAGRRAIENEQEKVARKYRSGGGFRDDELAEYGLNY